MEKDECVAPAEIESLPFYDSDSLVNASATYWLSRECPAVAYSMGHGFWYRLTGTGSCITASTAGSALNDTMIGVFQGECDDLVCVANNDDAMNSSSSLVTWRSAAGTSYRIFVAGYGYEVGPYNLNVTVRCAFEWIPLSGLTTDHLMLCFVIW